jgi:hypothetical protein
MPQLSTVSATCRVALTALVVACGSRTGLSAGAAGDGGVSEDAPSPHTARTCPYSRGAQKGAPWPMKGRCPDQDSRGEVAITGAPHEAWHLALGDAPGSPVIGAGGTIYVTAGTRLLAVSAEGSVTWTFDAGARLVDTPALDEDGSLYVVARDPKSNAVTLYAVGTDGAQRWAKIVADAGQPSAPILGPDGNVYVDMGEALHAVSHDGADVGTYPYPVNSSGGNAPAFGSDGTIYVALNGIQNLVALDPSGAEKWRFGMKKADPRFLLGAAVLQPAAVAPDGTIYVASGLHDGPASSFTTVFAVDPSGHLRWKQDFGAPGDICDSAPAVGKDGSVVFVNLQGTVGSLGPDGTLAWTFEARGRGGLSLGADGTVYVGGGKNTLQGITSAGTLAWGYDLGAPFYATPAIGAAGELVLTSSDGTLRVLAF